MFKQASYHKWHLDSEKKKKQDSKADGIWVRAGQGEERGGMGTGGINNNGSQ